MNKICLLDNHTDAWGSLNNAGYIKQSLFIRLNEDTNYNVIQLTPFSIRDHGTPGIWSLNPNDGVKLIPIMME